jgi:hypothetical protein
MDKLGINVFNGSYPESAPAKPKTLASIFNWFKVLFFFNPLTLTGLQSRFLNAIKRQRTAIKSMDELTQKNLLLETRHQLMRQGFKVKSIAKLFVLLEYTWQSYWKTGFSTKVTWAAFLMLKGCAVTIRGIEKEQAMLLCASTAALTNIPVHWLVSDEPRATSLIEKYAILFQALTIEISSVEKKPPVMIITPEQLARDYLWDKQLLGKSQGYLGLLLHKLGGEISTFTQLHRQGLCFALIENIDFWLMEKAFATVEINESQQQITLHELFSRHLRCAGNLLTPPNLNQALWSRYQVVPIGLPASQHNQQKTNKYCRITFFRNLAKKWETIANRLDEIKFTQTCLIVTTSESLDKLHHLSQASKLPMVKEMRGGIVHHLQTNNLLILAEPFPWLGLEEWLEDIKCRLIIIDFGDSFRLLSHLEQICSPNLSIEMIFSLEDKWLQKIEKSATHDWLAQLLRGQKTVNGTIAHWLLKSLLSQVEKKRQKLNDEMTRWLWQKERMFSFFKK